LFFVPVITEIINAIYIYFNKMTHCTLLSRAGNHIVVLKV